MVCLINMKHSTFVSGSTNAKRVVFCSSQRIFMVQPLVRPFSKEAGWNLRRIESH